MSPSIALFSFEAFLWFCPGFFASFAIIFRYGIWNLSILVRNSSLAILQFSPREFPNNFHYEFPSQTLRSIKVLTKCKLYSNSILRYTILLILFKKKLLNTKECHLETWFMVYVNPLCTNNDGFINCLNNIHLGNKLCYYADHKSYIEPLTEHCINTVSQTHRQRNIVSK